jgi:hypothetical protein
MAMRISTEPTIRKIVGKMAGVLGEPGSSA